MTTEAWLEVAHWAMIITIVAFLLNFFLEGKDEDKDKDKPA